MTDYRNQKDMGLNDSRTPPDFRCLECGSEPRLTDGREIYPHRDDLYAKRFYKCDTCASSYCGCHPNTTTPLGYPCGERTRKARNAAHAVIDPIWRDNLASRRQVYKDLAQKMGVKPDHCHVAWMTAEEAQRAAVKALEIRKFYETRAKGQHRR